MYKSIISLGLTVVMLFAASVSPVSASLKSGIKSDNPSIPSNATSTFCDTVTEIPVAECNALVALYNSTNGPGWTNHIRWLETDKPCSWYGITCTSGHVTVITLRNNILDGYIPPELGNLTYLTRLDLFINQLKGSIPPQLSNMTNLKTLLLACNQLTGNIPPELGNLINLTDLDLEENQLQGGIPPELGKLINLEAIILVQNNLSGRIPDELGNLSKLVGISFGDNQLTGAIPSVFGDLLNLHWIDVERNQLSGIIPPELGNLTNLTSLYLDNNQITGNIPPSLGNLINLQELYLDDNLLSGPIPVEFFGLSSLRYLNMSDNQLTGNLPPQIANLNSLYELWLFNNQLSGNIPSQIGSLSNLQQLDLENNQLSGSLPSTLVNLSKLTFLALGSNQMSGSLPVSITSLTNLTTLSIWNNALYTSDPAVIAFLDTKAPGWANTQTITPTDLHATGTVGTVQLSWTPIPYTWDGGSYEISYATSDSGPFAVHGTTSSKSASSYMVYGLNPGTPYFFRIRTNTPSHGEQQNNLWSEYSSTFSATPSYAPPQADFNGDPVSGIVPLDVAFTNSSTGVYNTCEWSFGDGATSTSCNPRHSYSTTGIYSVSLTVSGPGGSNGFSRENYIYVGAHTDITPDSGGSLVYTDIAGAQTDVQVPSEAVTSAVTLEFIPAASSMPPPNLSFADHAFDLSAYQNGEKLDSFVFQAPVTITIHYTDQDVSNVDENDLTLNYWDGSTSQWVDAATTCTPTSSYTRNLDENWLSVPVCHLSQFSLFGSSQYQLFLPSVIR